MQNPEILEKWAKFIKYDPKQTRFNLGSYWVHEGNNVIAKLGKYDSTGSLAVLYAKNLCKRVFQESAPKSYYDLLTNPLDFNEVKDIWNTFNLPEVMVAESKFSKIINNVIDKVTQGKLIGTEKTDTSIDYLLDVMAISVEALEKCHLDIYARGAISGNKINFSTHIHVFNNIEDCLLALNNASDAVYLCYIRLNDNAYGYFGFFIKDGGNIYSISERIDESYPGEFKRRRNNKYAEDKQYKLFPYEFIFNYEEHDYKGYAGKHIINEEKLNIFKLGGNAYMPIVIAMYLVWAAYWGKIPEGKLSYIFSLAVKTKIAQIDTGKSLVVPNNTALSNTYIQNPLANFDNEKFLNGDYAAFFGNRDEGDGWQDDGIFTNEKQIFVDTYGRDFDASHLSLDSIHYKALTSTEKGATLEESMGNTEFIGSEKRMQLVNYWWARKALAAHIQDNMNKELEAFGGIKAISEWYQNKINANLYNIVHAIARVCDSVDKHDSDQLYKTLKKLMVIQNYHYPRGNHPDPCIIINKHIADDVFNLICPVTKTRVSFCFTFIPQRWEEIPDILGLTKEDLPKIIKGWTKRPGHYGNNLINMVDPVAMLKHPVSETYSGWERNKGYYGFSFSIGFSKKGFTAICNELGIAPRKFWAEGKEEIRVQTPVYDDEL